MRSQGFEGAEMTRVACGDEPEKQPGFRGHVTKKSRRASVIAMGWFAFSKQLMPESAKPE